MRKVKTETPEISPEEFKEFITNLMNKEIIPFLYEKNKKYKGASFQNGVLALVGNLFRQEDKLLRYKHLVFTWLETGMNEFDEPFGESIWDTIRDQLGYALIAMTIASLYDIGPYKFKDFSQPMSQDEVWKKVLQNSMERSSSGPFGYEEEEDEEELLGLKEVNLSINVEEFFLENMDSPQLFVSNLKRALLEKSERICDAKFFEEVKRIL